ncbi:MAG: hypothetical protein AVDCRST_MAG18-2902 [uncultured Thermomicrobiales bacterium]|uniref:DUF1330 domain-containing protein n=1 Tax=uncultured Thermomicrobiales bacterium TaxID=1645740 RepID=A0A6J4VGU9_9BACT|nr:MAG: hypothetical protein AVDCRST_MAG18-2902 [uncultured Thermomicrobiales bacterium]
MAAYIIVDVVVTDPEGFAAYREMAPPTVAAYGGNYLARGGALTPLEGGWDPKRISVIEFPSAEQAHAWWDSAEYAEAKALRQRTTETKMLIVEGL